MKLHPALFIFLISLQCTVLPSASTIKKKPSNSGQLEIPQEVLKALAELPEDFQLFTSEKNVNEKLEQNITKKINSIRDYVTSLKGALSEYFILLRMLKKIECLESLLRDARRGIIAPQKHNLAAISEDAPLKKTRQRGYLRASIDFNNPENIKALILKIKGNLETVITKYNTDLYEAKSKKRTFAIMMNNLAPIIQEYEDEYQRLTSLPLPKVADTPHEIIMFEYMLPDSLNRLTECLTLGHEQLAPAKEQLTQEYAPATAAHSTRTRRVESASDLGVPYEVKKPQQKEVGGGSGSSGSSASDFTK